MKTKSLLILTALACLGGVAGGSEAIELKLDSERRILKTTNDECVIQVEVTGRKKPDEKRKVPMNLAIVLDRSGSMSGAKIERARQAAVLALGLVGPDDTFALVVYDNDVETIIPAGKVKDVSALEKRVHAINSGGSTALHAGVTEGATQLRKFFDKEKINRVILLSDGIANVGPSSPSDLAKLGSELASGGISVSTIGLGDDYNEDLMTALAEASHANYYYVKDAEKLPDIFAEELGTVKSVVARNLRLIITLPEGIVGKAVLGEKEFEFKSGSVTIPVGEVSAGQRRRFLVKVAVPAGDAKEIQLAKVAMEYADADGATQNQRAAYSAQRTASVEVSEQSLQAGVAGNVAVMSNRLAKEEAVALADEGKVAEAASRLRRQAQANAALPAAAQNDIIRAEQEVLAQRASEMEATGGLSKSQRKLIQYENYQDKKQKR
ncbi:MAG: VWA domain-containing protein [Terrimicrobiaceae bacterium]